MLYGMLYNNKNMAVMDIKKKSFYSDMKCHDRRDYNLQESECREQGGVKQGNCAMGFGVCCVFQ